MTGPVQVELHPAAIEEALAATEWYRERSEEAADAFGAEVDRAIELIGEAPERWPPYLRATRRFLLQKMRYLLSSHRIQTWYCRKSSP